jgi:cell division inhibitor SulA
MNRTYFQYQQVTTDTIGLNPLELGATEQRIVKSYQDGQQQTYSHVVKTEDTLSANFELIKILRSFHQSGRWTLLIAPENIPDKTLLNCCSVDMDNVLVVHEKRINSVMATIENALSQATCSAVVAWCDNISGNKMRQINELAERAQCHFYAFNKHSGDNTAQPAAH